MTDPATITAISTLGVAVAGLLGIVVRQRARLTKHREANETQVHVTAIEAVAAEAATKATMLTTLFERVESQDRRLDAQAAQLADCHTQHSECKSQVALLSSRLDALDDDVTRRVQVAVRRTLSPPGGTPAVTEDMDDG